MYKVLIKKVIFFNCPKTFSLLFATLFASFVADIDFPPPIMIMRRRKRRRRKRKRRVRESGVRR